MVNVAALSEVDTMIVKFENLKSIIKTISRKTQRSGSLEWYTLSEENNVQVLYAYAYDDLSTPMEVHSHPKSWEHFIILSGELEVNNKTYIAGDSCSIPPGMLHSARPLSIDTTFIVIIYPPEEAYRP